ncbi:MAG: methyl-accepting chemotaxis sensory transducer [Parcubacteria group bacterium Gr01-1014_38]|nr:MAG: methyl-accepting chemotaxis sensory transducer [Parcubacteria group bacterium Gr01-1014_38]
MNQEGNEQGNKAQQSGTDELRRQITEAESSLSDIKNKIEEIQKYYQQFQELKSKIDDGTVGLNAVFKFSQDKKTELEQLSATANEKLAAITQALERVQQHTDEINRAYEAFQASRDKVNDPGSGLQAVLGQAQNLRDNVAEFKAKAEQVFEQIQTQLNQVRDSTSRMEEAYRQFEVTKQQIDDPNSGLGALLQTASDLRAKIQEAQKSASNTLVEIQTLHENAKQVLGSTTDIRNRMDVLEKESVSLKESIAQILSLVTDSSLDDAFKRRSQAVRDETKEWRRRLEWSIGLLVFAIILIYILQSLAPNGWQNWKHWYRYLFTSPLIFAVIFYTRQYTLTRSYAEKYAFKSVVATTLTSYVKLLNDRFPERKDELLDFTLKTTDLIYERPFVEKDTRRKAHLSLFNIFRGKLELDEKTTAKIASRIGHKKPELEASGDTQE